jgi:hypothetical protein
MSDHLDRSQVILAELLNAPDRGFDLRQEQQQARDLVDENRLLRASAIRAGNTSQAALLDDLERVLLDIANGSSQRADDTEALRRRIENDGLLFKVRITSMDAREKGQKL